MDNHNHTHTCKRLTVSALGISLKKDRFITTTATNFHPKDRPCSEVPGACGAVHAEQALLAQSQPEIIYITHSPCLDCAKTIVKAQTIKLVVYKTPYRILDGIQYLEENGIMVINLQ